MTAGLAFSDVLNVQVAITPNGATLRNFGVLLMVGSSSVIDTGSRVRQYSNLAGVAGDYSNTMPEYLAAKDFFAQVPTPATLNIGRWARSATSGVLNGAILNSAQQATLLTALQAINNGSIRLTVDGTLRNVTGLNFTNITNLNGAASVINGSLTGATMAWMPDSNARFVVTSASTGTSSAVSYASAVGTGIDVSTLLGLTAAAGASVPVAGIVAETPLQAVQACTASSLLVGGSYGIMMADSTVTDNQHLAISAYVEGSSPTLMYGVTTQEPAAIDPTQTTDLASLCQSLKFRHTILQYSSYDPYAIACAFGRGFTVDFTGTRTVITLMWKSLQGLQAETLTETQAATLKAKNCNAFANYQGGAAIFQPGVMTDGSWWDVIYGTDWLQNYVQTNMFNLFYTNTTKIAQTDSDMHVVGTNISNSLQQGVVNGLIAPGVWNASGFGQLQQGQMLSTGFYVYIPPMSSQSQTVRATRVAPTIQCAIKLGGAIHSANVIINVNQ